MTATTTAGRRPVARQVVLTLGYIACVLGSMVGVGVFGGTPIAEAAGGALAADATHLAPGSGAFSVWSVIYVGLGGYTLWQWWDREDHRRVAWPALASLLLNAAWILVVQAGRLWLSVVVIAALLGVLALLFRRLLAGRPRSAVEAVVADGTFGLYLGWVSVATCANVAAALAAAGFTGGGRPEAWAVGVLVAVAVVGVGLAVVGRGRLAPAATLVWGVAWNAVARTTGQPRSTLTAVAAATAAAVVVAPTVSCRRRAAATDRSPAPRTHRPTTQEVR